MKMFHSIFFLNVLEGIKQFHLSMLFKETRLETSFKGNNVKALIKTSNCDFFLFLLESSENCSICYAFLISVTKQSLESVFGFPQWSEIPTLSASLKI